MNHTTVRYIIFSCQWAFQSFNDIPPTSYLTVEFSINSSFASSEQVSRVIRYGLPNWHLTILVLKPRYGSRGYMSNTFLLYMYIYCSLNLLIYTRLNRNRPAAANLICECKYLTGKWFCCWHGLLPSINFISARSIAVINRLNRFLPNGIF